MSRFIHAYKSANSRLSKKEYPEIRCKLWKEAFWSQSFCLITAGGALIEGTKPYIESQGDPMNKALKFRIYPTDEQANLIHKTFGCCRFLYNQMLADKNRAYEETQKMLKVTPAPYKKKYPWLKEVDSLALSNTQLHLEAAYRKFFREPKIGFPKFKAKHTARKSYTTNVVNGNIRLEEGRLRLPKVGKVKIRVHRTVPDGWKLKSVTISEEPTGKFYASLLFAYEACENQTDHVQNEKVLGIDYAMNGMAVFSTGEKCANPGYYRKAQQRLAREQMRLSHCKKGGRNYQKQKRKVARRHEKIRNQRRDYLHKLSHSIAESYDAVAVEDLDMKAMSRCLNFGKSVMDNGYGMFLEMLSYKLEERGKRLVKVDRFYPSSKKCSQCGEVKKELALSERTYHCSCGNHMDRDVNAAINIREEGKRILCA